MRLALIGLALLVSQEDPVLKLKTVAKFGNLEIQVMKGVSNGIDFSDWKSDGKTVTCIMVLRQGSKFDTRWDTYDSDKVRITGALFRSTDFLLDEKTRKTWKIAKNSKARYLKITRDRR